MKTPTPSLGYVILYVENVDASLSFYEKAFGFSRRFFSAEEGKAYGELETGATRIAFANLAQAKDSLQQPDLALSPPHASPLPFEVALVTPDVAGLFAQAAEAGAKKVVEPTEKPWGQTVAYVRDLDGYLVEICTPMS
ncbi:MAG: VOC family protein [Verrucomicrobiota bacterium]